MYVMSRINPDQFTEIAQYGLWLRDLLTVSAKLLEPTTKRFTKAFDSLKASALNAATLWGTAAALIGLGIAIGSITKGLSRIMEVLQKGHIAANVSALVVVTASIVAMMLAMRQLSLALVVGEKAMNHKVILSTAVELVALSGAIKVISTALKPLSEIKFTSLVKAGMAVVSLGGLLTTMATALAAVNKVIGPDRISKWSRDRSMAGGIWIAAQAGEQSGEHSACPAGCGHDQHQDPDAPDDHHVGLFVQDEVRLRRGHPGDVYLPCCTGRSRGAVCRDGRCGGDRAD